MLTLVSKLYLDNDDDTFPFHFFKHLNVYLDYPASKYNLSHCIAIVETLSTYVSSWTGRHIVALLLHVNALSDWVRDNGHWVKEEEFLSSVGASNLTSSRPH